MRGSRIVRSAPALLGVLVVLAWAPAVVWGQEEKPEPAPAELKVGDPAPPLKVAKWLKGQPVTAFEPGKVYVVEFWATWCGPCIASMPHLSALQKEYRDKGLTIIGTNVWEDKEYTDATLTKVEEFVKQQGDRMAYTVAYDGPAKAMEKAYLRAAGRSGIPCVFLVDKTGRIAWIGHPMWLDVPIEQVVADKWDRQRGPEQIARAQEQLNAIMRQAQTAPREAVAAWERFAREYPAAARNMTDLHLSILLAAGEYEPAYKLAGQLVETAIAEKDAQKLNDIAWTIVDPDGPVEKKDLDLAMKAASKAVEFTRNENAPILDTLARVHFLKGDIDQAIAVQTRAVELAKGRMKEQLERVLEEYRQAKSK